MKFNWKIGLGILLFIGVVAGAPVVGHYRAKWALEAYRKQIIQRGEKLTPSEIAPPSTADEIGAGRDVLAVAQRFRSSPALTNWPVVMRSLAPGHAMVSWAEEILPTDDSSNVWPGLNREIQFHEQDLAGLSALPEMPAVDFDIDYSKGFNVPLTHLLRTKQAALWSSMAAINSWHEGRPDEAWNSMKVCIGTTRWLSREPWMISQLVRVAMGQIGVSATWEGLQSASLTEARLNELQAMWNALDFLESLEPSLEMERALAGPTYEQMRASSYDALGFLVTGGSSAMEDVGQAIDNPREGFEALMQRYPHHWMWKLQWSYEEELYHIQIQQAALEALRRFQTNGAFVSEIRRYEADLARIKQLHTGGEQRFFFGFDDGTIDKYLGKIAAMEMERRLLVTAIALKRYQLREKKYPAQLQDLVPNYLANVPLDPMDGKPLRYQPKPDGTFLLYSVGEDGVDNGGDPTPTQSDGVANKSWWKARDAVWPWPATAEEVKAYKQEALAKWQQNEARKKPVTSRPPPRAPSTNAN